MTVEEKRVWKAKIDRKLSDLGFSCSTCVHFGKCGYVNQSFVQGIKYCGYWKPKVVVMPVEECAEMDSRAEEEKSQHWDDVVNRTRGL